MSERIAIDSSRCCAVVELRQYTLKPGQRDVLIALFEREFVEPQEAVGARVIGQFRDLDKPDRFVWLRGFSDMDTRKLALSTFYGGPVWKAHRNAANETMIDSDDVMLLKPVAGVGGFVVPASRPAAGASALADSRIVATIWYRAAPVDDAFVAFFRDTVQPLLSETGSTPIAAFQTEYAENTFPALPVRLGEHAFVWFTSHADTDAMQRQSAALARSTAWRERVLPILARGEAKPAERIVLQPAARSALR